MEKAPEASPDEPQRPAGRPRRAVPAAEFAPDRGHRHPLVETLRAAQAGERDALLSDRPFPLVEPGAVSFVWRGPADRVALRHFMSQATGELAFERLSDRLWHLRLRVPDGARFEYKIDVVRGDHGEWVNDPLNPLLATDPFGANSVCQTHGYVAPEWAVRRPGVPRGRIEAMGVDSDAFGDVRKLGVYLPADHHEGRYYPLVIVHDGFDYVEHASLTTILDNLIHRGDLPPLIAALTQSPDRSTEYVDDPRHARFVADEVLPALEAPYEIDPRPHRRVLMGASLGAVASLSVADREPRRFGNVVLMSGSFIVDRSMLEGRAKLFERISHFVEGLSLEERHLRHAFVCCGRYEGLAGQNRDIAALLRRTGVRTRYVESRDAHHWQNWRDQTRAGLMWCLGPGAGPVKAT